MTLKICHDPNCRFPCTTKNIVKMEKNGFSNDGRQYLWFDCPGCHTCHVLITQPRTAEKLNRKSWRAYAQYIPLKSGNFDRLLFQQLRSPKRS